MHPQDYVTVKGTYYFRSYNAARAFAEEYAQPGYRLVCYMHGWAVQFYTSGPYAGPSMW
jgi:hypothetical protein